MYDHCHKHCCCSLCTSDKAREAKIDMFINYYRKFKWWEIFKMYGYLAKFLVGFVIGFSMIFFAQFLIELFSIIF